MKILEKDEVKILFREMVGGRSTRTRREILKKTVFLHGLRGLPVQRDEGMKALGNSGIEVVGGNFKASTTKFLRQIL